MNKSRLQEDGEGDMEGQQQQDNYNKLADDDIQSDEWESDSVSDREPAIEKLRRIVHKHFMSQTLEEIEAYDMGVVPPKRRLLFGRFLRLLNEVMPNDETPCVRSKYVTVGNNQWRNEYLREVVTKRPDYNDYLNVHSGDGDFRTNKIEQVEKKK